MSCIRNTGRNTASLQPLSVKENLYLKQMISPPKPSSRRRRGPASVRLSRELSASLWNRTSISARAFTTASSPTVTWAPLYALKKCTKSKTRNKLLLIKGTGSRARFKRVDNEDRILAHCHLGSIMCCEKCTKTINKLILIKGTTVGHEIDSNVLTKMNSFRAN